MVLQDALKLVELERQERRAGQFPGPAASALQKARETHAALIDTAEWLWAYEHGQLSPGNR